VNRVRRYYPLLFVTVTGAVVMGLEILGTRVIGTVFGASLFVWGALLATTLVCLAAGYALGGLIADRWPRDWVLYGLTMLAGGACLLIPAAQAVLEPCARRFGLRGGALAAAFLIFAAPLTLLGMASPYVVRLLARRVAATGRTAGGVFALSTVGSVAGTLFVSFYMIPALGTRWALVVMAGALLCVSVVGLALSFGLKALPTALLLFALVPVARGGPPIHEEVLYRTESPYGRIAVVQLAGQDDAPYRLLFNNGIMQTGMPLDIERRGRGSLLHNEDYYLELVPYFFDDPDEPREGLLIGVAGGLFARVMEQYPVTLTAVEIDIKAAELAEAYFGYRGAIHYPDGRERPVDLTRFPRRELGAPHAAEDGASGESPIERSEYAGCLVIDDGRRFLRTSDDTYDFIVLDAYSGDTIPFHLITREMFQCVREHLAEDGLLAVNYIGAPAGDEVTDSLIRTLRQVFGKSSVVAYRSTEDPDPVQVIYLFAFRDGPREVTWPTGRWAAEAWRLAHRLESRRLAFPPDCGTVITDDLNPIDVARVKTALRWRAQTLAEFGRLQLHRF